MWISQIAKKNLWQRKHLVPHKSRGLGRVILLRGESGWVAKMLMENCTKQKNLWQKNSNFIENTVFLIGLGWVWSAKRWYEECYKQCSSQKMQFHKKFSHLVLITLRRIVLGWVELGWVKSVTRRGKVARISRDPTFGQIKLNTTRNSFWVGSR